MRMAKKLFFLILESARFKGTLYRNLARASPGVNPGGSGSDPKVI